MCEDNPETDDIDDCVAHYDNLGECVEDRQAVSIVREYLPSMITQLWIIPG